MYNKIIKFGIYLTIIIISLLLISCESNDGLIPKGTGDLKSNSKTLIEFFTNTSCTGCPIVGHYLDRINNLEGVTINDTNVIIIRVHTSLFPNDPFHNFNTIDNLARQTYYGAGTFNPIGFANGSMLPVPFDENGWTTQINMKLSQKSNFGLNLINTLDTITRNGTLSIQIGQFSGQPINDLVLHIALTEGDLYYNAPNGETHFFNILRDLITPCSGESISVIPGQSTIINKEYTIDNRVVIRNCEIIVFVQCSSTKQVLVVDKIVL